ncbi:hypothetical protein [Klebsiella oxytoca]|uniref:hypothetical protein n=1 Tax=Klebsiella oxytoca TaxID=571 RepID=UPI001CC96283|nr:hypothetical protein [Klebsiella oxytoca]MBZ7706784.1 hypothetical protein [Klebsiella oxytoca]MCW9444918.1 hypothetical protein [Klebsiella oxytoca]HDX8961118.1 hypothetical protein [Klebsiella oxytoca]HDX9160901.1 hypothetical protein [Klebsiella oxytoca]
MNLLDFCVETYGSGDRALRNGIEPNKDNVSAMLNVVFTTLKDGIQGDVSNYPPIKTLLNLELTPNGGFNMNYLPDLIAIVFDVVTDRNRNPELWFRKIGGISDEISVTFSKLLYGPIGHVTHSGTGAAHGKNYESVRSKFINDLDADIFRG